LQHQLAYGNIRQLHTGPVRTCWRGTPYLR
jgi:hypothetical protein